MVIINEDNTKTVKKELEKRTRSQQKKSKKTGW
jgi:hypothetical protein